MIFDDERQMLRLEVIDTGFFDEDMTLELFGDEGEPDADGIRHVSDVKVILDRAFGALDDPETNQGRILHAAWALAEPGDPAHDEAGWCETGGDFHRDHTDAERGLHRRAPLRPQGTRSGLGSLTLPSAGTHGLR